MTKKVLREGGASVVEETCLTGAIAVLAVDAPLATASARMEASAVGALMTLRGSCGECEELQQVDRCSQSPLSSHLKPRSAKAQ